MRTPLRVLVGSLFRASRLAAFLAVTAPVVAQTTEHHALGTMQWSPAQAGLLVVAPHGSFDGNTDRIALEVARHLRTGHLIARQFAADGLRVNVNRPTEGAHRACDAEIHSPRAAEVFELYRRSVVAASGDRPLRLYVEIHGNNDPRLMQTVEIATRGVTAEQARSLKRIFAEELAHARARHSGMPDPRVLVEPDDPLIMAAGCAKRHGLLGKHPLPRVLHLELPRALREGSAIPATSALIAAVVRRFLEDQR